MGARVDFLNQALLGTIQPRCYQRWQIFAVAAYDAAMCEQGVYVLHVVAINKISNSLYTSHATYLTRFLMTPCYNYKMPLKAIPWNKAGQIRENSEQVNIYTNYIMNNKNTFKH